MNRAATYGIVGDERDIEASCERSVSRNVNTTFGRPIGMPVSPALWMPTSCTNKAQLTTGADAGIWMYLWNLLPNLWRSE